VRPRYFVPIHGEYRHLARHVALAAGSGIPEDRCFLLEDGDTLLMSGDEVRRGRKVEVGRVVADGEELGAPALIRERRALARDGTVIAILAVSMQTGKIIAGPELLSRGVVSGDGTSPHMARAQAEVLERLRGVDGLRHGHSTRLRDEMTRALRRYFSDALGKRPIIVPHVMEV
jgi:ribonuclease J